MTKRVMWKKLFGLEGTTARVYKDKTSWGFYLKVENHPLSGGLHDPNWKGWTPAQAKIVVNKLRNAGFDASLHMNMKSNGFECTIFAVSEDEKTVARNKLTAKERKLLGV